MTNEEQKRPQEPTPPTTPTPTDPLLRSMRAWNELLTASTDMAFDMVLKNWDYSRSLRGAADQAVADALKMQQRLNKEMLQAWRGYASDITDILDQKPGAKSQESEGKNSGSDS
jgi:hypothetical protein